MPERFRTQYSYDPLGRTTSALETDNSTAGSVYSGNSIVTTDEVGNQRRSYTDAVARLVEVDEPGPTLVSATVSTGNVTISPGPLQSKQVQTQWAASGGVTVWVSGGPDQTKTIDPCYPHGSCPTTIPNSGTVSITVDGITAQVSYGPNSTVGSLAIALGSGLNGSTLNASGSSSGAITITAKSTGASTNYGFSTSATWMSSTCPDGNPCFGSSPFYFSPSSGALSGGKDNEYTTIYDQGTATITINGEAVSYPWSGPGTTSTSIAQGLAGVVTNSSSYATATFTGSTVYLTSRTGGGGVNYSLSSSTTYDSGDFSSPSFVTSNSGGDMTGGADPQYLGSGTDSTNTPAITLYGYDALNNLICVVQTATSGFTPNLANCQAASPSWRPRWFQYDSLSHLVSSHNPETENIGYSYDLNGNLAIKTDARSITTNYYYDQLNRLTEKTYQNDPSNTAVVKYGYDGVAGVVNCPPAFLPTYPVDKRTSMCDAAGTESWSYPMTPNVGWQTIDQRTTNGVTKTITTQDNLDGSTASVTYPSGRTITSNPYNGAGRPTEAVDNTNQINYVTNASYTAFGSVSGMTNGGSITVANTYNARMQPWTLTASNSQGGQILSLTYDFHLGADNGNVYQIANGRDPNRTQNFSYDLVNRISEAWTSGPNWGETFTIDPWGNLTSRSPVQGKTYYEPLSVQATVNNQLTGFGYDAAGNMTQSGGAAYAYDAENHLISAGGVNYTYDGDGNRVMKSNGTIYWGPGPLAESDGSGNVEREYILFDGKRVARLDVPTNAPHYYFSNHLGSTSVVTNASGTTPFDEDIDYFPYGGEVTGSTENVSQNYKFTGKERDAESGLDNFEARYDASSMGRFMTPDPMGGHLEDPQTLNKYAYVRNNPTTLTDPTGLDSYLSCQQASSTCQSQTVGYDKNGKAQTALVQGVTNADKSFTATLIGNQNPNGTGPLVDKTTGTGTYTASANGSGVQFSNNGGQTSSSGVFVNGTPETKFQDAGFANGNALSGFTFTLTNSKLEAGQTEAGSFTFAGTPDQAGAALQKAGFSPRSGENVGMNEYRSPGSFWTGANSAHFNVFQIGLKPWLSVPQAQGDMHFGEHDPKSVFGGPIHFREWRQ